MLTHILAASVLSGLHGRGTVQQMVRRLHVENRPSVDVEQELLETSNPGLTFLSYDPTDNSVIVRGDEATLNSILQKMTVLDKSQDTAWVLSARKPFGDYENFLEFTGPGEVDAGADTITLQVGSVLTVDFHAASGTGYVVVFRGSADSATVAQVDSGDGPQDMPPFSKDTSQMVVRSVIPPTPKSGLKSVRCTLKVGNFSVKSVTIQRTR